MRKIHCLNPISKLGTGLLTENYEMTDNLAEAEGILVRSAAMHDLELPKGLRAVARAGAGVNNIPLDKCAEAGVVVFNTPGANANGVKELVLAGMLLGARDVVGGIDWCKEQKDNENISKDMEKAKKKFAGHEIRGKKLGVIGLGAIGAEVANAAAALGMEVYGYDPFISVKAAWMLSRDVKHITSVDTIYQECDYITVHVPLTDETKDMISAPQFKQMKSTAVLINAARGGLVDEAAAAEALQSGKLAAAAFDAFEQEPLKDSPLLTAPNAILLPHTGSHTVDATKRMGMLAVDNVIRELSGTNCGYRVK